MPDAQTPMLPIRAMRALSRKLGYHPEDDTPLDANLKDRRALIICTSHRKLTEKKDTGVFASEMTAPYYAFLDAGMHVDIASPRGGPVPIDPLSIKSVVRTPADDRFLADADLLHKVNNSLHIPDLDFTTYDIIFMAGGWGAAFDLGQSEILGEKVSEAWAAGKVVGGVCHGPLGLLRACKPDGTPLVQDMKLTCVTDKQVHQLGVGATPLHPETELRRAGARFEAQSALSDIFANHWVVDGNLVTGQNQNAGPMVAREMMKLIANRRSDA